MERLNRLVGTMLMLQSRRVVRAEDIAQHFGVSVRTVYRDLRALDEAGFPVAAEAGVGYSLVDGYHLPPVSFTQDEAGALIVGGKFVEQFTDQSLGKQIASALAKIQAVLPPSARDYVERLQNATAVQRPPQRPKALQTDITTIQDAVANRRVLWIEYYANYRDATDGRSIEPLGLLYYGENWHLIGFCRMRQAVRDFRMDRILRLEVSEECFPPHEGFSLKEYIRRSWSDHEPMHEVRILLTRMAARFAESKQHYGLVEERITDDGVEMTFMVHTLGGIAPWILSYGPAATILQPERLRDIVCTMARATLEKYEAELIPA